jgi:ribosome-associated heat shock protein Hsp15
MAGMRLDKWLWAARFFKTRALAAHACELGRVESNGLRLKASRELHPGDLLTVTNESGRFEIRVLELSQMRGPAATARNLYQETDESAARRAQLAEALRASGAAVGGNGGKPSKRDRRRREQFMGRG